MLFWKSISEPKHMLSQVSTCVVQTVTLVVSETFVRRWHIIFFNRFSGVLISVTAERSGAQSVAEPHLLH